MIDKKQATYRTVQFSKTRRFITDVLSLGQRKHLVHGLLEVDVTEARRRTREVRARTGETPSFTAFVVGCVARAVAENKMMHAYRKRGDRLLLFDEVDVSTMVEVEQGGRRFPLGHVIRAANKRPLPAIHEEIRRVQAGKKKASASLPGAARGFSLLRLPAFLRRLLYQITLRKPEAMKEAAGTVLVTAVGMFGNGAGWGIPISMHTLTVTLGGIAERPGVVDGKVRVREFLDVTLSFDHDIVDGAPAARFTKRLRELVESGYGLHEGWESVESTDDKRGNEHE